jgi:hypothetical protein
VVALLLYGPAVAQRAPAAKGWMMKAARQQQAKRQDTTKVPGWLRDPKSRRAEIERPQLDESTRVSPVHDDRADEEPGYGHGV